jgi:peptide/nickel transport system permease protein
MFSRKKQQHLATNLATTPSDQSYWAIVKRQFNKNRLAVWSLRCLLVLVGIAIFADFLANEKPLWCTIDGKSFSPVVRNYAVSLGLARWDEKFITTPWSEQTYQSVVHAPIPYSPTTMDKKNKHFKSPFDEQRIESIRWKHWLGTDQQGRDVAAGMIHGTRIAMMVGILSMLIATCIGIFIGSLAGYFGDTKLQMSRIRLILLPFALFATWFYTLAIRATFLAQSSVLRQLLLCTLIAAGILLVFHLLTTLLKRIPALGKKITLSVDLAVMRLIEIFNSIPSLLLILSIVAIIEKPNILYVMIIIGFISWTGIASFIRAELLRVRNLEYIEAAEAMGFSNLRIILRHAIPNALTPVLISIAFGVAGAILTEAFLSFLSVGVSAEQVTWGSLLNIARGKFDAWWLAIFPGLAIFFTVTLFNLIGEGLTDALDPRLKQ